MESYYMLSEYVINNNWICNDLNVKIDLFKITFVTNLKFMNVNNKSSFNDISLVRLKKASLLTIIS